MLVTSYINYFLNFFTNGWKPLAAQLIQSTNNNSTKNEYERTKNFAKGKCENFYQIQWRVIL